MRSDDSYLNLSSYVRRKLKHLRLMWKAKSITTCTVGFVVACMTSVSVASDIVPAPRGWDESLVSQSRVITKGTSIIEVGPWRDLKGQSLPDYLATHEQSVPNGTVFLSSEGVKPDSDSDGFTVTRKVELHGKSGQSLLYLCPGQPGVARMMSATVESRLSKIGDLITAGKFVIKVCESEPQGRVLTSTQSTVSMTPAATQPQMNNSAGNSRLSAENDKIPAANRPVSAAFISEDTFSGFPVTLKVVPHMMMTFPNGYSTYCVKWDLLAQSPTPDSIDGKGCRLSAEKPGDKVLADFKAGETVELALGRTVGASYSFGAFATNQLISGDLAMTKDGRIAVGSFNVRSGNRTSESNDDRNIKKNIVGRYYLNGYTITIEAEDGQIYHSFFGGLKDDNGRVSSVFLADKYYYKKK